MVRSDRKQQNSVKQLSFNKKLILKSGYLICKYMGLKKVMLILISHFDINFSFKCFLLCNHLCAFFSLTLLRLLMAKLKISLSKCHIVLENATAIFKYLLVFISNTIPQ